MSRFTAIALLGLFSPLLLVQAFSPSTTSHASWRLSSEVCEVVEESSLTTSAETTPLPPVLQHIADERREYQLALGKAMDILRRDMPEILRRKPGKFILDGNC